MKKLTWITFALLTVASTASIAQLTSAAEYGMGAIFIYLFPAVVFLLPVSLVAAELATGWKGGVFEWVQAALEIDGAFKLFGFNGFKAWRFILRFYHLPLPHWHFHSDNKVSQKMDSLLASSFWSYFGPQLL